MKTDKLIRLYRQESRDLKTPGLLSDSDVVLRLIEAETEACRRGLIFRDSTTADVCEVAVTADDPWVTLDPRVLKIFSAELWTPYVDDPTSTRKDELTLEHSKDLPRGWRLESGETIALVTDLELGKLRCYPISTVDAVIHLGVVRLPLADMTTEPSIPPAYHMRLVDWVIYKALGNADGELYDPKLSAAALARFEAMFGSEASVNDDLWIGNKGNPRRKHTRFF